MASFLSNLLGGRGSSDATLGATRTVDLSGNKFSFAMPEDFSKDMPAENLIEHLDISDLKKFDNPEYGNLIRRWWDIKEPGFFGKNLGTVMMDISVQRVAENKLKDIHERPYNIVDRLDFLLMLDDALHQRYDELVEQTRGLEEKFIYSIPSTAHLMGKEIRTGFRDRIYNNQKWIGYSVGAPSYQLITGLVTPLTNELYVEVLFTFSPNNGVFPREFRDFAYVKTQMIEASLRIDFEKNNTIQNAMKNKDWLKATNNQILQRHKDLLLVPFFGPDIYERLELQDQQVAEVTKAIAKWDDESETH